jgi:hypothetical protein
MWLTHVKFKHLFGGVVVVVAYAAFVPFPSLPLFPSLLNGTLGYNPRKLLLKTVWILVQYRI